MSRTSMKLPRASRRDSLAATAEPVGIVISRGREPESAPRFSAYVYAPDPEGAEVADEVLAGV